MPHLCTTAVMEAKKWLKEKKSSNSKLKLDHGTCTSNSVMSLPVSNSFICSLTLIVCVCVRVACTRLFLLRWILVPCDCNFSFSHDMK